MEGRAVFDLRAVLAFLFMSLVLVIFNSIIEE